MFLRIIALQSFFDCALDKCGGGFALLVSVRLNNGALALGYAEFHFFHLFFLPFCSCSLLCFADSHIFTSVRYIRDCAEIT